VPPTAPAEPLVAVVIPALNEAGKIGRVLDKFPRDGRFEAIVVDDGSTDGTGDALAARIAAGATQLRHIRHDRSAGQSAAVRSGIFAARGAIVTTMDGDGQNDPAYLPKLADALTAAGPAAGIAAGQRLKRTDTRLTQFSSRFANGLREAILHDGTRDSGCGL
jgi:glycosyltransferase involved in cell wall biosynthesis